MRIGLTKKAEPRRICDVNRDSGTERATRRWLRRLVRHQNPHNKLKPVIAKLSAASCSPRETGASFLFKAAKTSVTNSNQKLSNRNLAASPAAAEPPKAQLQTTAKPPALAWCLTKKAEPPPTRGVNRDSGTDSANGGWLRRLVRLRIFYTHS